MASAADDPERATGLAPVELDDKYARADGRIFLTGVQALVRLPLLQRRRDEAAGLNTAGYVTGYRGSPLGTYDRELWSAKAHLATHHVTFVPGLNEDLAATSAWGSQQVGLSPGARYDGVFALWYAKGPGVDRSGDALKHANAAGTASRGGVLAIAGDDHACKSASLPSQSDYAFLDASIPVLHPADVSEVIRFGLLGWAMSRATGLWVGMKALADTMDSAASIDAGLAGGGVIIPEGMPRPEEVSIRWPDPPLEQERRLFDVRIPAAIRFARANGLNRIVVRPARSRRLMIVAVGKAAPDVRQAFALLGLRSDDELQRQGIGLSTVGMPWPLDPEFARLAAEGFDEVLIVEEKRPLVEEQFARALINAPAAARPRLVGKQDENGRPLLTPRGALSTLEIARVIAGRLALSGSDAALAARLAQLSAPPVDGGAGGALKRVPTFCSGCPHSRSTIVPEGSRALAGIGCHFMAQWMDRETAMFSQMGGEGAAWIGQEPFTTTKHVFVNLGDGTYAHSGILAIRAAISARATITYKILYNDAVAMTGGQAAEGGFTVAQIVAQLRAEGVTAIRVVAEQPERFAAGDLPADVPVRPRTELDAVQRELRELPGVTVLVFDQVCAAEKRRRRKRGLLPDAGRRVVINEAVCEGCGDCGRVSNCVSLVPVETPFGRKRQVDQTSCNQDATCVEGFCPSFVTIEGGRPRTKAAVATPPPPAPTPPRTVTGDTAIVIAGIGGTGVVTIGAVLGMAAHLEGRGVTVLDQVGMAQKGGAVTSHIQISASHDVARNPVRIAQGGAQTLIACDMIVGADPDVLSLLASKEAVAIANTYLTPTSDFPRQPDLDLSMRRQAQAIAARADTLFADLSAIATRILGDAVGANMMALGMAWQRGRVPLSEAAILRAIELNGAAVEMNAAAFRWGRALANDPDAAALFVERREPTEGVSLDAVIARCERHLNAYQNPQLAARYRGLVDRIATAEAQVAPGSHVLTEAIARAYHKLLAIKDEYEVARLHTDADFLDGLSRVSEGGRRVFHLAPPLLARRDPLTGHPGKMRFGPWIVPVFRVLARMKALRGTPLDVFGWTAERKMERRLITEYEALLARLVGALSRENLGLATELAALPLEIRGFGHVKLDSVKMAYSRRDELLARWPGPSLKIKVSA